MSLTASQLLTISVLCISHNSSLGYESENEAAEEPAAQF